MKSIDELQEELVQLRDELKTVPIGLLVENPDIKRHSEIEVSMRFIQSEITRREVISVHEKVLRSWKATKAAWAMHKEDNQLKFEVLEYYEANKSEYRNARAAAKYIAGTIVPLKFETVYRHILKHNKSV